MVSWTFVLTCLLLAVVPGPSFAVLINQSVRHGRTAGLATVLGNTTGLLIWAVASAFGLTALIKASEVAFVAIGLVRRTLSRPAVQARVEQISGVVLVGLGLRMAVMSRSAL